MAVVSEAIEFMKPDKVELAGSAAYGTGIEGTKGIYNAQDQLSIPVVAAGLEARLDAWWKIGTIQWAEPGDVPVGLSGGWTMHGGLGGGITYEYNPTGTIDIYIGVGIGAGTMVSGAQLDFIIP